MRFKLAPVRRFKGSGPAHSNPPSPTEDPVKGTAMLPQEFTFFPTISRNAEGEFKVTSDCSLRLMNKLSNGDKCLVTGTARLTSLPRSYFATQVVKLDESAQVCLMLQAVDFGTGLSFAASD